MLADRKGPDREMEAEKQARDRYAALVDKKFRSSLSESEHAELSRLKVYLDEADAKFYKPIEQKLRTALTKLRKLHLER